MDGNAGLIASPVVRLIEELERLPSVGPKTAQRLAFYLLRVSEQQARDLAEAIISVKERVRFCTICFNITEADPCGICVSTARDRTQICVVEEPVDILALERPRLYHGLYHVLGGVISPLAGVQPEDLRIEELMRRLGGGEVREIIMATNPTLEGDYTANYLQKRLAGQGTMVTRLARGVSVGSDILYADEITLRRAFEGRREF